jgi:GT2 family glycosyltransferase
MKLSIVILNYNRVDETRHTIEHLQQIVTQYNDIEVIAVDNASIDGTGDYLNQVSKKYNWLKFISMNTNTGIAGYNEGFKLANGEYILVLDDDSYPKNKQSINNLIAYLDNNTKVGVVACRIEFPNGKAVSSWHLPKNIDKPNSSIAFIGCGFIIRRKLFEYIGWYPSEFFLYQNDVDVALKVRQQGYEIHYEPSCQVIHREAPKGRTNWRRVYYPTRNTIWLIRRYYPKYLAVYMIFSRLCIGLFRTLQSGEFSWYFKAVKEAFFTPVKANLLSKELRNEYKIFWKQNSLWHHLIGKAF